MSEKIMSHLNSFRTLFPRWSFFAEPGYACGYHLRIAQKIVSPSGMHQTIWENWANLWVPSVFKPWHLFLNPQSNHYAWILAQTEEWRANPSTFVEAKESDQLDVQKLIFLQLHLQKFIQEKISSQPNSLWQLRLGLVSQKSAQDFTELHLFPVRSGRQGLFDGT